MPTGRLSLLGVASQQVFARGLLDKYHIEFVCAKRREYKNAANMLTEARGRVWWSLHCGCSSVLVSCS